MQLLKKIIVNTKKSIKEEKNEKELKVLSQSELHY